MSFRQYAQMGPVSRQAPRPQPEPSAASYGSFMMQMLPQMMQQARNQLHGVQPTPEQMMGRDPAQPLGQQMPYAQDMPVPPPQNPYEITQQPPTQGPPLMGMAPPPWLNPGQTVITPKNPPLMGMAPPPFLNPGQEHIPSRNPDVPPMEAPPMSQSPDPEYMRGALLAKMREGLGR